MQMNNFLMTCNGRQLSHSSLCMNVFHPPSENYLEYLTPEVTLEFEENILSQQEKTVLHDNLYMIQWVAMC